MTNLVFNELNYMQKKIRVKKIMKYHDKAVNNITKPITIKNLTTNTNQDKKES